MNLRQKLLLGLVVVNFGLTALLWTRSHLIVAERSPAPHGWDRQPVAATRDYDMLRTRLASVEDKLRMGWATLGPGRDDPRGIRKYPPR